MRLWRLLYNHSFITMQLRVPLRSFTDTFRFTNFTINRRDISWPTDRQVRFSSLNITEDLLQGTVKPPNWPTDLSQLEGGLQNEALIVWFRVSALPWFRKLYGRIETNIPAGTYTVDVEYSILYTGHVIV